MCANFLIEADTIIVDTDGDSVIDTLEDLNSYGILDDDDTDMDGIPNYQDPDDENDLVLTIDEYYNGNGHPTDDDTNNNGIPNYLDSDVALGVETKFF